MSSQTTDTGTRVCADSHGPTPPLFHCHPALTKDGFQFFFHLFVKYREKPIILLAILMPDNDHVNEMQILVSV